VHVFRVFSHVIPREVIFLCKVKELFVILAFSRDASTSYIVNGSGNPFLEVAAFSDKFVSDLKPIEKNLSPKNAKINRKSSRILRPCGRGENLAAAAVQCAWPIM
jgi:hypothetical protein